jgi:hypothetical protein
MDPILSDPIQEFMIVPSGMDPTRSDPILSDAGAYTHPRALAFSHQNRLGWFADFHVTFVLSFQMLVPVCGFSLDPGVQPPEPPASVCWFSFDFHLTLAFSLQNAWAGSRIFIGPWPSATRTAWAGLLIFMWHLFSAFKCLGRFADVGVCVVLVIVAVVAVVAVGVVIGDVGVVDAADADVDDAADADHADDAHEPDDDVKYLEYEESYGFMIQYPSPSKQNTTK